VLRPRLKTFLQGILATLQNPRKGYLWYKLEKPCKTRHPRPETFLEGIFENCKANFKSFLLLTAEKRVSVRTRCGRAACEQGGKGLVDHSEACQWAEVSLVVLSSVWKHSDEKSWLLSLRNWHGQGADIIFGLKWPQHIATCKYNFAGLSYCRMNECTHSSQVQSWIIYGRDFMPSCATLVHMHCCCGHMHVKCDFIVIPRSLKAEPQNLTHKLFLLNKKHLGVLSST